MWVGGPTHYKPLRDKVAFELGIPGNMDVDPMTAVAEGASLFAESIDWSSDRAAQEEDSRGQISSEDITFNYIDSRTPTGTAKIAVQINRRSLSMVLSSRLIVLIPDGPRVAFHLRIAQLLT